MTPARERAIEATSTLFLRTVCRSCDGTVVATTDTGADGTTPYTVTGAITFVIIAHGEEVTVEIANTEDACKIAEIFVNNGVIFQTSYSSAMT